MLTPSKVSFYAHVAVAHREKTAPDVRSSVQLEVDQS